MSNKYDVAAYIWPAYYNDERSKRFWPKGIGEWESVISATAKFEGHSWPRKPIWGYVNESDPYVMEMQINAAAEHGVNVFIYDWYWYDKQPFLEGCLNNGYLKAKNNDKVKFYLMWANHDATTIWDKKLSDEQNTLIWSGSQDRAEFEIICNRLIRKYFLHPSYYKIDDKPVFMIYDVQTLIDGLGGVENTKEALNWFRKQAKKAGLKGLHLQCTLRKRSDLNITGVAGDNFGTQKEIIDSLGFDSLTHYQFAHFTKINNDYLDIREQVIREWDCITKNYDISYFPHVSIGWDNNPRFIKFKPGIVTNNQPENFKKMLISAREYINNHSLNARLVTINSWNEWTETSYLQPCDRYGYGYLEAIREVFLDCEEVAL